jgi:hypothetical protein
MRLIRAILVTALLVNVASAAVEDHVVGVWHAGMNWLPPGVKVQYGSGICVDRTCSIVATSYHAQLRAHSPNLRVMGGRVRKTVPYPTNTDSNQADVRVGNEHFTYNVAKDITFLYTTKPISHKEGVRYSFNCEVGQEVTIVGTHSVTSGQHARIVGVNVPLRLGDAAINENVIVDVALKPGDSGSAVFDHNGRLLGMIILAGRIVTRRGPLSVSVALPASTIAKALRTVDPKAASDIFSEIPQDETSHVASTWIDMATSDFEPLDSSEARVAEVSEVILPTIENLGVFSSNASDPIEKLRAKADTASKLMNNLLATECLISKRRQCYQVSVFEGDKQYREISKRGTPGPTTTNPFRRNGKPRSLWSRSSWADDIASIGEMPWNFEGAVGSGYVFSGRGRVEDDRCWFTESPASIPIFQPYQPEWEGSVDCLEVLFTNSDFQVLSLYTEFYPPAHCLTERMNIVIEYQWVRLEGVDEPVLLPIKENLSARIRGQKQPLSATVLWSDYRKFRVDHKIRF